jgi:electron transfer flavoprotein alpha subunit
MTMAAKIVTLAEHNGSALKEISFELLGLAHRVEGGAEIKTIILGKGVEELAETLARRGASEVIYVEGDALASYTSDGYRRALEPVLREESPDLLLIGNTPEGWDVAPPLAARLGVPLASGCSAVALDTDGARITRKAFNGKFVHEVVVENVSPVIATVDKGASAPHDNETSGAVRKLTTNVGPDELRARYVETRKGESSGLDLTDASVIVAAGRGVGAPEKLDVLRELADALGAQIGASRAVTDAGWLPHEHQIGSSGVSVKPKLYIACGISGAIQHIVGMKSSGFIVAINKDADAPIFGVADVGVVADLFEIVPALTKSIKEAKG